MKIIQIKTVLKLGTDSNENNVLLYRKKVKMINITFCLKHFLLIQE